MNKVIISGRLTRDPELTLTTTGKAKCTFNVAVRRNFKNVDGEYDADFVRCVAWQRTAEFLSRYFVKGQAIMIEGSLRVETWVGEDGQQRWITQVHVDGIEFVGKKTDNPKPTMVDIPQDNVDENGDLLEDTDLIDFEPLDDASLPF